MSLKALNEHFPKLIELGLAGFEVNGDVWIIGNEASKNIYGRKLVPVAVDSNIIKTAYNSMMVRVHSNYHQQSRQIVKKQFRSDLLKQIDNPESNKQFRQAKRVQNKFGNEIDLNPDIVLSNIGYANIKVHGAQILTKSKGSYWKRKLRKLNFVSTRRRFKLIAECSYSDYLFAKQNNSISKNHIYCNGFLYKELISSLSLTV